MFTSSVVVCNKKVISVEIGHFIFSSLLTLLAVHFTYTLSYNPVSQQVLEFLQEKVLGDRLPPSRKTSMAYSNLYRAVSCLEHKFQVQVEDAEKSADETQEFCDFDKD